MFSSKTLLRVVQAIFGTVCLIGAVMLIVTIASMIRADEVEQMRSSTPIMDCDPEVISSCPATQPPPIDEFQDVILPTTGIVIVAGIIVGLMVHGSRRADG